MLDFSLTEEQQAFKALAGEFAEREVRPVAASLDQNPDPEKCFSWELFDKAAQVGLHNLTVSKKSGGYGVDWVTVAIMTEEICAVDGGFGTALMQGRWKVPKLLQELWTDKLQEKFIPSFASDPRYLFSAAMDEPEGGGSDNFLPFLDPKGGVKLRATRQGDYVVLNGMKHFITGGGKAKLYMVVTRTDSTKPIDQGVTIFMVPADTPGFRIGRFHDKLGVRLMTNAELIFEDCRVPMENQVGSWNTGLTEVTRFVPMSNIIDGTVCLGIARGIFEKTLEYTKIRVQGGVPIIEHQAVKLLLAEMWLSIEAAWDMLWKGAWAGQKYVDHHRPEDWNPILFKAPKILAADAAVQVAFKALEIFAGYGIMKEVGLEKMVRDALSMHHVDGTNMIQKLAIGKLLSLT